MSNPLASVRGKRLRHQFMTPFFWAFAAACSLELVGEVTDIGPSPDGWANLGRSLMKCLAIQSVVTGLTVLNWLFVGKIVAVLTDDALHTVDTVIPWSDITCITYAIVYPRTLEEDSGISLYIGSRRPRVAVARVYTKNGIYFLRQAPRRLLKEARKRAPHIIIK